MNFVEIAWSNYDKKSNPSHFKKNTKSMVERVMGTYVKKVYLWKESYSSNIYKIETDEKIIIAKQWKRDNKRDLKNEYNTLKKLKAIDSNYLNVPNIYGIDETNNFYLLDYIEGQLISQFIEENLERSEAACHIAGKTLADIHNAWLENSVEYKSMKEIYEDVKLIPGGLRRGEKEIFKNLLEKNGQLEIPIGKVYKDFDPLNIYFEDDMITIIDPPPELVEAYTYWDVATFIVGIKKASLKKKRFVKRENLERYITSFTNGYLNNVQYNDISARQFQLALKLLEIQRCVQLMVYQKINEKRNNIISKNKIYHLVALKLLRREVKYKLKELSSFIS